MTPFPFRSLYFGTKKLGKLKSGPLTFVATALPFVRPLLGVTYKHKIICKAKYGL